MKSQFVRIPTLTGNNNQGTNHPAGNANGWGVNSDDSYFQQPQPGQMIQSAGPVSNATLNWQAGGPSLQPPQPMQQPPQVAWQPGTTGFSAPSTYEQGGQAGYPVTNPGFGGPGFNSQTGMPSVAPMSPAAPFSPHDPGIGPFPTRNPGPQMASFPAMMAPQVQAPPSQPLPPMPTPLSQSLPPMQAPPSQPLPPMGNPFGMPGMGTMPSTGTLPPPMGYPPRPGAGGPPIFGPPQPPENGGRGGKRRKKRRVPIWARVVIGFLLFMLLLGGAGFAYYQMNFARPIGDITNQQAGRLKGDEDPNAGRTGDILSGPRINILLLGSDTDEKFTNADGSHTYLAQTDIIITIDPATKQVGMLSIPRDFWINIPGYGLGKLDEAFAHGMDNGGLLQGVALSRLTIFQDFGIPINYYAWVGLNGFVKVIDTVGGVDVDVLHPITDDTYPDDVGNNTGDLYAYKRLYIAPGPQHLSGIEALEYVRSRHADLVGDFGRSARQQQVLSALKTKLNNPDIIGKLSDIAKDLDGYVKTDMQLPDVLKLMNFARGLDPNKIQRVILGPPYSTSGTVTAGGTQKDVVFPHCDQIVPVIAQMFGLGNKAQCNIAASNSNTNLAVAGPPAPDTAATSSNAGISAFASSSALSLLGGGDNMFGFHSLLDLMFGVVFGTPEAMQV